MKIVVLDGYAANPGDISWEMLEKLGELVVYDRTEPEQTIANIGDADAILTNKVMITEQVMNACPNLKYVGVTATGYNVVDIEAARKHSVTVTNIPAYSTPSVAQMTFALLLEVCQQVGRHSNGVQQGRWVRSADFCYWDESLTELSGKTFGIIGFGNIGRKVAKIAEAFDMEVLAYSRHPKKEFETAHTHYAPLEEVIAKSDVLSLHCPLTDENAGLINRETIAKMKDGAILLNTARGGLIIEQDLADALRNGKLKAAGLDVLSAEPMAKNSPFLGLSNCYITPHIAWAPLESRLRLFDIAAGNISAYQQGKPINVVS